MTWQSGGGGAAYPGVTPDGQDPPGINVAGGVNSDGPVGVQTLTVAGDGTPGSQVTIHGSGGGVVFVANGDGSINGGTTPQWNVGPDGSFSVPAITTSTDMASIGGFGVWDGGVFDAQPVLATGAGHTVDDVITLLQNYGLCKQV